MYFTDEPPEIKKHILTAIMLCALTPQVLKHMHLKNDIGWNTLFGEIACTQN